MKKPFVTIASVMLTSLSLWANPSWAGDPFRTSNPRNIGDNTEAAFNAIFKEGNYPAAKRYLTQAETTEPGEPLAYAMRASLAYTEKDWNTLKDYAVKTTTAAQQLTPRDEVRGNLYTAVGLFLEGTYTFKQEGPVGAVAKLQQVLQKLDEAEKKAPNDPELNLLKGYMDLILAVNLPFSNPDQAIARLERYASPKFLADRGIAIGYRDLDQFSQALDRVQRSLQAAPNNPELFYLKAQILAEQGKSQKNVSLLRQSLENFDKALEKKAQLPESLVRQITRERGKVQREIDQPS